MNIQAKSFWKLTPNNFIDMYIGFKKRQQTEMFMVRKLITYLGATVGTNITDEQVYPLPLIDNKIIDKKPSKPMVLTDEDVEKAEKRYKLIQAELEKRKKEIV